MTERICGINDFYTIEINDHRVTEFYNHLNERTTLLGGYIGTVMDEHILITTNAAYNCNRFMASKIFDIDNAIICYSKFGDSEINTAQAIIVQRGGCEDDEPSHITAFITVKYLDNNFSLVCKSDMIPIPGRIIGSVKKTTFNGNHIFLIESFDSVRNNMLLNRHLTRIKAENFFGASIQTTEHFDHVNSHFELSEFNAITKLHCMDAIRFESKDLGISKMFVSLWGFKYYEIYCNEITEILYESDYFVVVRTDEDKIIIIGRDLKTLDTRVTETPLIVNKDSKVSVKEKDQSTFTINGFEYHL